ncbi:MAG: hypothetical protein P1U46_01315 [Patescibacteria group bacterium]|nr:hypothetical protein [Patescibacteria group bacterium]
MSITTGGIFSCSSYIQSLSVSTSYIIASFEFSITHVQLTMYCCASGFDSIFPIYILHVQLL